MNTIHTPSQKNREFIISPDSWTEVLPLEKIFDMSKELEVDVGCGRGNFLASRARENPDTNFLGVDRLLTRLRKVNIKIKRDELLNVRLLRIEASYAIEFMLPPGSVSVYYVFFPDPWPKKRHHKRRMFNKPFLDLLFTTMKDGGAIHVATDHLQYAEEIQTLLTEHDGFEEIETFVPAEHEKTEFETIFLTKNADIGRCSFRKSAK